MKLYLFRHGAAEDAQPGLRDADRALTEQGRKKSGEVIQTAKKAGLEPSLVISSPYLRAMETAQVAAEELGYKGEIVKMDALVPNGPPETVWHELRAYRAESAVLLAGHEPLMSRLMAYLLACPALRVEMKKSAMVRVDIESFGPAPHGTLRWMITPKLAD